MAIDGFMDLSDYDFEDSGPADLKGYYEFYPGQFFTSKDFLEGTGEYPHYAYVPGSWNIHMDPDNPDESGYGTYRLRVRLNQLPPELSLRLYEYQSAYSLIVANRTIASMGIVSSDPTEAVPRNRSTIVRIPHEMLSPDSPEPIDLEIILQMSNYHHPSGGLIEPVLLGPYSKFQNDMNRENAYILIISGILLATAIFHISIYFFKSLRGGIFSFGMISFSYLAYMFTVGNRLILLFFPHISYETMNAIEHATVYGTIPLWIQYFNRSFSLDMNWIIQYALQLTGIIILILISTIPFNIYRDHIILANVYALASFLFIVYYLTTVIRAGRFSALFALIALIPIMLGAYHDLFYYSGPPMLPAGLTFFLLLQIRIISIKVNNIYKTNQELLVQRELDNQELTRQLKERNRSLSKADDEIQQVNKHKSIFMANMSHELRTPLNTILGYSQLLLEDPEINESRKEFVGTLHQSGLQLLENINDILSYTDIDSGRNRMEESAFDLYALLDELEKRFLTQTKFKQLNFTVTRSPNLPRNIISDRMKLKRIIQNLLDNAIKFTDSGDVQLRVILEEHDLPMRLIVEAEDNGPGIPEDRMESIFESFEKIEYGKNAGSSGMGLGLSIVKRYLKIMNGNVEIINKNTRGCIFRVIIPVRIPVYQKTHAETGSPDQEYPTERLKALIVDDNKLNLDLLNRILLVRGFDVFQAENGMEAVLLYQKRSPDIILMDIRMPVMNGYEAMSRIRELDGEKHTPILVVTASIHPEKTRMVMEHGADDYISKPFLIKDLTDKIGNLLNIQIRRREPDHKRFNKNVAKIPHDIKEKISKAAIIGDQDIFLEQILDIKEVDIELYEYLKNRAENFRWHDIIRALNGKHGR